jgi:hypothetical protein
MTVEAVVALEQRNHLFALPDPPVREIGVALVNRNVVDVAPLTPLRISVALANRQAVDAWGAVSPATALVGATMVQRMRARVRPLCADVLSALPPTDDLGWTAPDAAPAPLWSLTVTIGGNPVPNARLSSLTIDLDARCGYESCAVSIATPRATRWKSRTPIVVTYDGVNLFEGILRTQRRTVGSELGWALEFVGRFERLRKQRAFRHIYADSDLTQWRLDQPGGGVPVSD